MTPCLTLSIIRYVSRIKCNNPEKGVAPSPTFWWSSQWKGSHWVAHDYGRPTLLIIILSNIKLATVVEGDQKAPFPIATTPRCKGVRYSFPWTAPLYPWYVPYIAECYARRYQVPYFESLVKTRPGTEPRSSGPFGEHSTHLDNEPDNLFLQSNKQKETTVDKRVKQTKIPTTLLTTQILYYLTKFGKKDRKTNDNYRPDIIFSDSCYKTFLKYIFKEYHCPARLQPKIWVAILVGC